MLAISLEDKIQLSLTCESQQFCLGPRHRLNSLFPPIQQLGEESQSTTRRGGNGEGEAEEVRGTEKEKGWEWGEPMTHTDTESV